VVVRDVAVSFNGIIAVSAFATEQKSRKIVDVIVWLDSKGSTLRIVRTTPFAVKSLSFTEDGSLWATGIIKIDRDNAHPTHDIIRQYDSNGILIKSLLSRSHFSYDHWHPVSESLLASSRQYIAFISSSSRTWILISITGEVLSQGRLDLSNQLSIQAASATDSGRVFFTGRWSGNPMFPLFEAVPNSNQDIIRSQVIPSTEFGLLLGSESEELIFHFPFHPYFGIVRTSVY